MSDFKFLTTSQFGASLHPPMSTRRVRDFCKPEIIDGLVVIKRNKNKSYLIPKGTPDPRTMEINRNGRGPDKKPRKKREDLLTKMRKSGAKIIPITLEKGILSEKTKKMVLKIEALRKAPGNSKLRFRKSV